MQLEASCSVTELDDSDVWTATFPFVQTLNARKVMQYAKSIRTRRSRCNLLQAVPNCQENRTTGSHKLSGHNSRASRHNHQIHVVKSHVQALFAAHLGRGGKGRQDSPKNKTVERATTGWVRANTPIPVPVPVVFWESLWLGNRQKHARRCILPVVPNAWVGPHTNGTPPY